MSVPLLNEKKKPTECFVCCRNRLNQISCCYCSISACNECQEKYILSTPNPKCMSCTKDWNYDFLRKNFTKTFMNKKYKEYKENLLLDIEKSLLPETQNIIYNKKLLEKELEGIDEQVEEFSEILNRLVRKQNRLRNYLRVEDYNGINLYIQNKDKEDNKNENKEEEKKEKKTFIKPCPATDCRGFLSSQYKCGLCDTKCCPECHEILPKESKDQIDNRKKLENDIKNMLISEDEKKIQLQELKDKFDHKCDPNIVQTIKTLHKECRNCPKCGTFIYKISGCNMMFCTSCKTAFDWKTGEIATKNIHNPHYFEYLRQNGQEDDEIRRRFGGGNINEVITNLDCLNYEDVSQSLMQSNYNELFRMITHLERVDLHHYRNNLNDQNSNLDLRLNYLEKRISENDFKIKLQRRFKKSQFDTEMRQILEMYSTVIKETFTKFIRDLDPELKNKMIVTFAGRYEYRTFRKFRYPDSSKLVADLYKLQNYVSNTILDITDKYGYSFPKLDLLKEKCFDFIPSVHTNSNNV